jgi:hypothetical protein
MVKKDKRLWIAEDLYNKLEIKAKERNQTVDEYVLDIIRLFITKVHDTPTVLIVE